jgi:hypothetical protein
MFGCIYPDMCIAYNITSSDRSIQWMHPGVNAATSGRVI